MAISTEISSLLADQLFAIYSSAEQTMLQKVAKRVARGVTTEGWNERKLRDIVNTRSEVEKLVNDVGKLSKAQLSKAIIEAYKTGQRSAETDFKLPKSFMREVAPMQVQRLLLEANNMIAQTNVVILRGIMDEYRNIQAEVSMGVTTGVETRKQITQRMLNKLADKGITSFIDKAGRRWEMASYAEMATRTVTARAAVQGHIDRQTEAGRDLVIVSKDGMPCPVCKKWEGRVLSISGKDTRYPSVAQATSAGLFHPNCKHNLSGFIPGLSRVSNDSDPTPDTRKYEYTQRQRENERQIRRWKRREAVATTPKDLAQAKAKISEYQKAQRELLKGFEHEFGVTLRRKYDRESISNRSGIKGVDGAPTWTTIKPRPIPKAVPKPKTLEALRSKYGVALETVGDVKLDTRFYDLFDRTISNVNKKLPSEYSFDKLADKVVFMKHREGSRERGSASGKEIVLNSRQYDNTEYGLESVLEDVDVLYQGSEPRHIARNLNPLHTVTHEIGHLLHDQIIRTKYGKDPMHEGKGQRTKMLTEIRKEVLASFGLTARKENHPKIGQELSFYASQDPYEFFAEAFMENIDNPKPRPMALKFWEVLKKYL